MSAQRFMGYTSHDILEMAEKAENWDAVRNHPEAKRIAREAKILRLTGERDRINAAIAEIEAGE